MKLLHLRVEWEFDNGQTLGIAQNGTLMSETEWDILYADLCEARDKDRLVDVSVKLVIKEPVP